MPFQHHLLRDESLGIWLQAQAKGKSKRIELTTTQPKPEAALTTLHLLFYVPEEQWQQLTESQSLSSNGTGKNSENPGLEGISGLPHTPGAEGAGQEPKPFSEEFCPPALPCFRGKGLSAQEYPNTRL